MYGEMASNDDVLLIVETELLFVVLLLSPANKMIFLLYQMSAKLNPNCFQTTEMAFSVGQYAEQRKDDR